MNSTGYYNANGIAQPYTPGYGQPAGQHFYAQKNQDKEDIKNSNVRIDVYKTVYDAVDPSSDYKTNVVPKSTYEPYNEQPIPKAACKPGVPVVEDAQVSDDELNPEKVNVLEPEAYQQKANTNTPNIRTTFYDKQNNLWKFDEKKSI